MRQIAERVGARYVVSGSVRKAGATLRVTAQLIDARQRQQLWTENYDRSSTTAICSRSRTTSPITSWRPSPTNTAFCARSMVHGVPSEIDPRMTPTQLLVQVWGLQHRPPGRRARRAARRPRTRLETHPTTRTCGPSLANHVVVEHSSAFNPRPDSLGRAQRAARRAIEIDRANQSGWLWLGWRTFTCRIAPASKRQRARDHQPA